MFKQQLEETNMQEDYSMDAFLIKIKDFKEKLLNINDMSSDKQLVSCRSSKFISRHYTRLLTSHKESFSFDELISLLLQESQSQANQDIFIVVIKLLLPHTSSKANKDKYKISTSHDEKKKMWNYCHKPGHDISEWRKREAREEKKKQVGLSVTTSTSKKEEAHIAQQ